MSPSDKKLIEDQQLHIQELENEIRMLKNASDGLRDKVEELQEELKDASDLKAFIRE